MSSLILIVALSSAAFQTPAPAAASGRVSGMIASASTGAPIADVRVVLAVDPSGLGPQAPRSSGIAREVRTGADGRFAIENVPPGQATLTVSTIGYIFVRRRIMVPADGALDVTIPLAEGTGTYEESVTVTPVSETAPAGDVRELSSGALQDLRGVAADDPVRAVQALPGVATGDDFQAEFSVRGSAYRHLGLVIDGVATPLLFHAVRGTEDTGSIAMINTDIVSRAALRTGAHPAKHGNWLGATLEFDLREGSRDRVVVRGAVSGTSASSVVEGPLTRDRRGSWLVSVRKSYVDWLIRKLDSEIDSTIGFVDTQAKLVYDVTPRQQVQLLVLAGTATYRKSAATAANDIARATSTSTLVSAAWRFASERVLATQRLSVVGNRFKNRGLFFQEQARGDTDAIVWRGDVTLPVHTWTVEAGANSERQHTSTVLRNFSTATATVTRVRAERSIDERRTMSGGWMSLGGRVAGVGLTTGLRVSHDTLAGDTYASPWLLAERDIRGTRLQFSASRAVQYSSIDNVAGATTPLSPERAWLLDFGVRRPLSKTFGVSAAAFRRSESDILRRTNENRLVNGARVVESIFPSVASALSGTSRGVDLVLERRTERGPSGWFGYTWAHTRHADRGSGETFDGDFDQRHTVNVYVQQRLSYRLRVSAKFRYGSNFPIVGYFEGTNDALRLSALRNQVRLPAYARLDLGGSRTFAFTSSRLTLFVEVMNVTKRDNYGPSDGADPHEPHGRGFLRATHSLRALGGDSARVLKE